VERVDALWTGGGPGLIMGLRKFSVVMTSADSKDRLWLTDATSKKVRDIDRNFWQ